MRVLLLRIGKSPFSWLGEELERLLEIQWTTRGALDLSPSVYEIEGSPSELRSRIVQVHAEHAASFLRRPESAVDYDISGLFQGELVLSPGKTYFPYANGAHREVRLADVQALRDLVSNLLRERRTHADREFPIELDRDLAPYLADQIRSENPLWSALLAEPEKKLWARLAQRYLRDGEL